MKTNYEECSDIVDFGKYKGKEISNIIDEDPSWVNWAVSKDIITLNDKVKERLIETNRNRVSLKRKGSSWDADYSAMDNYVSYSIIDGGFD